MLEQYNSWYRNVGVIAPSNLLKPKLTSNSEFTFPKNSFIHWTYNDTIPIIPRKNKDILNNVPSNTYVISTYEYPDSYTPLGKFTKDTSSVDMVIKELGKTELNFTFFRKDYMEKKDENSVYINSYGILNSRYNYTENKWTNYNRTINLLNTVIHHLRDLPLRRHFILIPLPNIMPDRITLLNLVNRFDKDDTKLKDMYTYQHVYLFELWRWLTPEYREKSVFNKISIDRSKTIDLVFVGVNKSFVVNMYTLLNCVKEYRIEKGSDGFKAEVVRRYLHGIFMSLNMVSLGMQLMKAKPTKLVDNRSDDELLNEESVEEDIKANENIEQETDIQKLLDSEDKDEVETNVNITADMDLAVSDVTSLEDLNKDTDLFENINNKLDVMVSKKLLTNKQYDNLKNALNQQLTETNIYTKEKLEDVLDSKNDDYTLDDSYKEIRNIPIVPDKDMNRKTIQSVDKSYRSKQYKKDLVRVFYSLQNNKSIVLDHNVELKESVTGALEEHTVKLKTLNGQDSEVKFVLPVIDNDGKFMYSNSKYIMRYQKLDLPIVKIAYDTVALTSFYGKLFIYKGRLSVENKGSWLLNNIVKKQDEGIENLITGKSDTKDLDLPLLYTMLGRNIKYFKYKDYTFNLEYNKRYDIFKTMSQEDKDKLEKRLKQDELVLIGKYKSKPMVIDYEDRLFVVEDNKYTELDDFYNMLNLDESSAPIEYSTIRVINKYIPIGILLCYYIGLSNLLTLLKVKYYTIESNKRVDLSKNQYVIKFKDIKYVITKDYSIGDMVLGGLVKIHKQIKDIPYNVFEDKNLFTIIFSRLELPISVITEIKLMENMYVDPMTKTVLKEMKEPLTFKGLLIRASELLVSDYYKNPNDIHNSLLKGYERIPGMVYKEMITALKEHENRIYFSKSKITINPYSVLQKIQEDSSTIAVDNLNPIAFIKQKEDTTQIGAGGRSKVAISKDNRQVDKSMIGIVSEAHKDSGDVGITSSLTADPLVSNTRGIFGDTEKDIQGWSNRISTSAMLAPFGLMDDVKRLNFASIMNSHVVPISDMRVPYVLTGYEAIIPCKADSGFIINAEDDGTVIDVKDKSIKVKYKEKGEVEYKFHDWTTKEESGGCYTHRLKPNFNKGDKFYKDDTLVYNTSFFEPLSFYPNRVVYKQGTMVTVALFENMETYEDSGAISYRIRESMKTTITKVYSNIVSVADNISGYKKVGDKVKVNETLYTTFDGMVDDDLDQETLELMMSLNSNTPKSKVDGTITKIEVRYNSNIADMSDSMKNFVNNINKDIKERTGFTGQVDSSYSVRGKKLLTNTIEIKYYIDAEDYMGIGDKAILGNQMKFTVGDVFFNDVKTTDGTAIDMLFSARSIGNRIVCSPFQIGTTSMLLEKITDNIVDMYFK